MALIQPSPHPAKTGNNSPLLLDISAANPLEILNNRPKKRRQGGMKHSALSVLTALVMMAAVPASAAGCYADYKAKQDNPLRLHYGVAEIRGTCTAANAQSELARRLAAHGWTLLNSVSVFGDDGLAQRKDSAGSNYLRF